MARQVSRRSRCARSSGMIGPARIATASRSIARSKASSTLRPRACVSITSWPAASSTWRSTARSPTTPWSMMTMVLIGSSPSPRQAGVGRAQLALEDLSARVLGQLVGDDDVARGLEAGEAVAAEARDLLGGQLVAGARHDDGGDGLDPARVRDAEHGRLGHRRVRVDDLLDLARGDVLAAGLDHVLLAVDDVEVALVVEDAEVAGVQPAVAERLGRLGGVVPVAEHRLRRAVHDLADLPGANRAAVVVDDLRLHVQRRAPGRAGLADLVLRPQHGRHRRHLGLAVEVEQPHSRQPLAEFGQHLDGHD